jgi:hypothetical protein
MGTVFELMSTDVPKKFDFRCFSSLRSLWGDRKWQEITAQAV